MYPNDAIDTYERNGLTVNIYPDTDALSPAEWDTLGTFVAGSSLWREYRFSDEHVDTELRDLAVYIRAARIAGHTVLPFRFDDYGSGGARIHETDADDANGYLLATREDVAKERAADGEEWEPLDTLRAELKDWDTYLQGDVYGYTLVTPHGAVVQSLWGLYGYDYAHEEANRDADRYTPYEIREADREELQTRRDGLAAKIWSIDAQLAELDK